MLQEVPGVGEQIGQGDPGVGRRAHRQRSGDGPQLSCSPWSGW